MMMEFQDGDGMLLCVLEERYSVFNMPTQQTAPPTQVQIHLELQLRLAIFQNKNIIVVHLIVSFYASIFS